MKSKILIQTEGMTKTFGKFSAITDLSLKIFEGQLTAIIGPNGAGKTTLINLLTGLLIPDRGTIIFNGENITTKNTNERVQRGIGRSFQVNNIFPQLTVQQNVLIPAFAHYKKTHSMIRRLTSFNEVFTYANQILEKVKLADCANILASELSHGDQRKLEIALAITTKPQLLILDEPTAGMNPVERRQILEFLTTLIKNSGITLILVEHDMDLVFTLADHVIVLNYGTLLSEGSPKEIQNDSQVLEVYLGAALHGTHIDRKKRKKSSEEGLLKVQEINTYYELAHILHNVSLEINRGETVALLGRNGVGKTTTLRSIMGITPPIRGAIRLQNENITGLPPYFISSRGVGYSPDDRRIFPNLTSLENLMLPTLHKKQKGTWTVEKVEEVFPPLRKLRHRKGQYLSGGEQKMLSIGRALMLNPDLLLLDEPSEGLSPLMIQLLLGGLIQIREEGVTTLVADQNLNFAHEIADRAYILDKGAVVYCGTIEALRTDEKVIQKHLVV